MLDLVPEKAYGVLHYRLQATVSCVVADVQFVLVASRGIARVGHVGQLLWAPLQ